VEDPALFLSFAGRCLFGSTASFAGYQLFYDGFVQGPFVFPVMRDWDTARELLADASRMNPTSLRQLVFSAENGPASRRLLEVLTAFADGYPTLWQGHPLAHGITDSRSFVEELRIRPSHSSHFMMWTAADFMLGQAEAARLFQAAALENIVARPTIILALLDNMVSVVFGPMANYTLGRRFIILPFIIMYSVTFQDPGLSESLRVKVQPNVLLPQFTTWWESNIVSYIYGFGYSFGKLLVSIAIIATIAFVLVSRMWWPGAVLATIIVYHHAVTAIVAEHLTRYVDQVAPISIVLAAIGLAAAHRVMRALSKIDPRI
jgi:hypothetical protein